MSEFTQEISAVLTEHLRYSPISLIDDVINTVATVQMYAIHQVEKVLFESVSPKHLGFSAPANKLPETDKDGRELLSDDARNELETGMHSLETLLENSMDRNFDRFELYVLRNLLNIEPSLAGYVRLRHQAGVEFEKGKERLDAASEEFERLRKERVKVSAQNLAIKQELQRNEQTLVLLRAAKEREPFKSLLNPETGVAEMAQSASFGTAQVELLKGFLKDLREKESQSRDREVEWKVKERERRRYVERLTRKRLEAEGVRIEEEDLDILSEGKNIGKPELLENAVEVLKGTAGGATDVEGDSEMS